MAAETRDTQDLVVSLIDPDASRLGERTSKAKIIGIMVALTLAMECGPMAATVFYPAAPQIAAHFRTTQVAWGASVVTLAAACLTPLVAKLGDLFGKKRVAVLRHDRGPARQHPVRGDEQFRAVHRRPWPGGPVDHRGNDLLRAHPGRHTAQVRVGRARRAWHRPRRGPDSGPVHRGRVRGRARHRGLPGSVLVPRRLQRGGDPAAGLPRAGVVRPRPPAVRPGRRRPARCRRRPDPGGPLQRAALGLGVRRHAHVPAGRPRGGGRVRPRRVACPRADVQHPDAAQSRDGDDVRDRFSRHPAHHGADLRHAAGRRDPGDPRPALRLRGIGHSLRRDHGWLRHPRHDLRPGRRAPGRPTSGPACR